VRRVLNRLLALGIGAAVFAMQPGWAAAANQKPDPDGLPPRDVKDLHYGDVLFYYYQQDYFQAITRLLAARELGRLPHTQGEAELLLGGLYLSLGEHVEAGRIFEDLLNSSTSEAVRNRAWYYLGKVWYQRGYLRESERALRQVSDKTDLRIAAERTMLLAELMLREDRTDEAIAVLQAWHGPPDWTAYARFNLGVALVRKGRLDDAVPILDSVGRMDVRGEEMLSLRDKANLALGFALLQGKRAREARPILERVRLEGPYSSKALLGVGWADANEGEFKRALVPWLALHKRNLLDAAVQESYLAVPYAYSSLHADGQAAAYYNSAIESFDAEMKLIDESIAQIREGKLLERLLGDDKDEIVTWYWQLKHLPDAPESRYLYQLLAGDEFQEGLKNYREIEIMSRNLEAWRDSISAFDDMISTRESAYALRVPKADAVLAAANLNARTRSRVDLESRINEIEQSHDVAALGTPEEQRTWARLRRVEDYLAAHPGDPNLADMREKHRLMKGVLYWRLSESFNARLWNERRALKELSTDLKETQRRTLLVSQARTSIPTNTGDYELRVAAVSRRLESLHERLAAASVRQNRYLQGLAIEELEGQKQRIETYQVQARYALASIYDRTISAPAPGVAAPGVAAPGVATPGVATPKATP
jgi:hypothetical protein